MKKRFVFFLIFTFILGLIPLDFSNAITQNQINSEVQIICPDDSGNWLSGSGTIIDPKGIILTNRHVVYNASNNICFIGFLESINQEPNFGTKENPNLAEVKYKTTTNDMDAAVLYLDNKASKTYPYVNIWNSNSNNLRFGNKIEVIGFPSIGGSTVTYTSGDFSGFGSQSDGTQNYIKTTALLEHGNSGGSAYNQNGEFVGIPSRVVIGSLNSISYVLSVNSIKKWLSGFLGNDYKQEIIEQKPITIQQPTISIQNDITPPYLKEFRLGFNALDDNGNRINGRDLSSVDVTKVIDPWNRLSFFWYENCSEKVCINDDSGTIKGYYYYFGKNPNANPKTDGKYIASEELIKETSRLYPNCVNPRVCNLNDFVTKVSLPEKFNFTQEGSYYFILQAIDGSNNISDSLINFEYVYELQDFKNLIKIEVYNYNKKKIGEIRYNNKVIDVAGLGLQGDSLRINTNQTKLFLKPVYDFKVNKYIALFVLDWKKGKDKKLAFNDCSYAKEKECNEGKVYQDFIEWTPSKGNLMFLKPYKKDRTTIFAVKYGVLKIINQKTKKIIEKDKNTDKNLGIILTNK